MADLTTGKMGDLVQILPQHARFAIDPRDEGRFAGWYESNFNDQEWKSIPTTEPFYLQGYLDAQGYPYLGALWYRLDVDVPASAKGRKVMLYAPAVECEAWVWVNGRFIGHREYHEAYERPNPIDLDVSAAIKPGARNQVAIRVHTSMNASAQAGGMTSRLLLYAPK
jgi:beta-galactosidase/beta-glucuronidase